MAWLDWLVGQSHLCRVLMRPSKGWAAPAPARKPSNHFLTSSGFWSRKIIVIVWVWFEQPLHIYSLSVPYTLWCKERVHKKIQPNLPLTQFCSWDFILPHLLSIASEFTLSFWRCQLPPPRPGSMVAKTASTFQPPDSTFLSLWPEAAHANNATSKNNAGQYYDKALDKSCFENVC